MSKLYDDVLNKQRQVIYARRKKLLIGSDSEVDSVLADIASSDPESIDITAKKRAELGEEKWYTLMRKLILQVTDLLWVEHLELMQYTRSSVNLRAYGQRDPLIEYRKEGNRLFKEMEYALHSRIIELVPNIGEEALKKEEAELSAVQKNAQLIGGSAVSGEGITVSTKTTSPTQPLRVGQKVGRNDTVTITNGTDTKSMKYKKAGSLIASGEWTLVR